MIQSNTTRIIVPEALAWKIRRSCQSLNRPVILGRISPQDDATVKCWGNNFSGQLGIGDTSSRGYNANGPCPPSSTAASLLPALKV